MFLDFGTRYSSECLSLNSHQLYIEFAPPNRSTLFCMTPLIVKYSFIARFFHWLSAFVILWAILSGSLLNFGGFPSGLKHQVAEFNVSLTFVFIPIFISRMLYRFYKGAPANFLLTRQQVRLAEAAHWLLYALVLLELLSGVLMMREDFLVFYWLAVPHLLTDVIWLDFFSSLHVYLSRALAVLVLGKPCISP